jgi:hypothetical protein
MLASDRRHLERMLQCVAAARAGDISLVAAADTLLALRSAVEYDEDGWADEITSHVATIESAGLATAEQRRVMGARYSEVVELALGSVEQAVTTVLARESAGGS